MKFLNFTELLANESTFIPNAYRFILERTTRHHITFSSLTIVLLFESQKCVSFN